MLPGSNSGGVNQFAYIVRSFVSYYGGDGFYRFNEIYVQADELARFVAWGVAYNCLVRASDWRP
jgi:hypothetical protein